MSVESSISETGFERRYAEDIALQTCPLCAWPNIDAVSFHEQDGTFATFAKVACARCGCRITGTSMEDLTQRWNSRPVTVR